MKKIIKTAIRILSILTVLLSGCALDLSATRPGETLTIHARPTARSNNASASVISPEN